MKDKVKNNIFCFFLGELWYGFLIGVCMMSVSLVDLIKESLSDLNMIGLVVGILIFVILSIVLLIRFIPAILFISVILAVLYSFVEEKRFPIVTSEGKLCRQNAEGYYVWNTFIRILKLEMLLLWVTWRYRIPWFVVILGMIYLICKTCFEIHAQDRLKYKMTGLLKDGAWRSKNVCTYLSVNDFGPYEHILGMNMKKILKPSDVTRVCKGSYGRIWESDEMLIFPHWLWREDGDNEVDISRFLLFVDRIEVFNRTIERWVEKLVDEFYAEDKDRVQKDGKAAAAYIPIGRHRKSKIVYELPVIRFLEEHKENDKAARYLTVGEDKVAVPYFECMALEHVYPKSRAAVMKYDYIDEEMKKIVNLEDSTECFYRLLKAIEYVWHYRALARLAMDKEGYKTFDGDSFKSSLGLWEKYQNRDKIKFTDWDTIQAYRLISDLLNGNACGNTKVSYAELCQVITQLRNRYVGHGTMAFSVSQELLEAVKQLAGHVLEVFYRQDDALIDEHYTFNGKIPLIYYNSEDRYSLCLFAGYLGGEGGLEEYLDYKNAAFRSKQIREYQLDYQYDRNTAGA